MKVFKNKQMEVKSDDSLLKFETTGGDNWKVWDRFISIENKKAYHIGNICGTCNFFFERLMGANKKISPNELIEKLKVSALDLSEEDLNTISKLLPSGKYLLAIMRVKPKLITLGTKNDYFTNELLESWGEEGFWGMPHNPKVQYYRGTDKVIDKDAKLFEFYIPIVPYKWLDEKTVNEYEKIFKEGKVPTAIALSHIDVKERADLPVENNKEVDRGFGKHICFANYIIDGHHKFYAANKLKREIDLLSFISYENSISTEEEIDVTIKNSAL